VNLVEAMLRPSVAAQRLAPLRGARICRARQRRQVCVSETGLAAMERRIESNDLRNLWRKLHDRADRGEVVRLKQGRKRLKSGEVVKHVLGHPHRRAVLEAAMDHAMADLSLSNMRPVPTPRQSLTPTRSSMGLSSPCNCCAF
jgi:hypothetical protein